MAGRPAAGGRPGLRRRGLAADARPHRAGPRDDGAPGDRHRGLRGVHPALPGGVERAADPVGALDAADGDGVRRPRRARRLEHLRRMAAHDPRRGLVAVPHRGRADELLALPAPGQPLTGGAGGRRAVGGAPAGRRRRGPAAGARPPGRRRGRRRTGGAVELPPRLRRRPAAGPGLTGRTCPRDGRALDGGRRGVGLDRRADAGLRLAPAAGELAAGAAPTLPARARGVERGGLRRRVGRSLGALGGEGAPGLRPRALGGVPPVLRASAGPRGRGRVRSAGAGTGDDHLSRRRRALLLSGARPLPGAARRDERRLAGRLLARAQPRPPPRPGRRPLRAHARPARPADCSCARRGCLRRGSPGRSIGARTSPTRSLRCCSRVAGRSCGGSAPRLSVPTSRWSCCSRSGSPSRPWLRRPRGDLPLEECFPLLQAPAARLLNRTAQPRSRGNHRSSRSLRSLPSGS